MAQPDDPFDLERFVRAQDEGGTYARALAELTAGRKTGHWMWFVLPQVAGLGGSAMSRRYAIASLDEARAYLAHPVLGPRLLETARRIATGPAPDAMGLLGPVDAQKLASSMTLFSRAAPTEPVFRAVLERYYAAVPDPATDKRL